MNAGDAGFLHDIGNLWHSFISSAEYVSLASGGLAGSVAGLVTNWIQNLEADVIPSLSSSSNTLDKPTEEAKFYAAVNDAVMSVTSAWNDARMRKNYDNFHMHLLESGLSGNISEAKERGKIILERLGTHKELSDELAEASTFFDNSWDYRSHDNYRTEVYFVTVPNGKNGTRTEMRTRQVYEDTDHYFTFHPEIASQAEAKMQEILRKFSPDSLYNPSLGNEDIVPTENDILQIKKTICEDTGKSLTAEEAAEFMNAWRKSSQLNTTLKASNNAIDQLQDFAGGSAFATIRNSDTSYHYNTTSTSHSGPTGYKNSNTFGNGSRKASMSILEVIESINSSLSNLDNLQKLLEQPEDIDKKEFAENALNLAVDTYEASFPESPIKIDQRVKAGWTAGIAIGAGIGVGSLTYLLYQ